MNQQIIVKGHKINVRYYGGDRELVFASAEDGTIKSGFINMQDIITINGIKYRWFSRYKVNGLGALHFEEKHITRWEYNDHKMTKAARNVIYEIEKECLERVAKGEFAEYIIREDIRHAEYEINRMKDDIAHLEDQIATWGLALRNHLQTVK